MPTLTATVFPDEAYVLLEADWKAFILIDDFDDRTVAPGGWGQPQIGSTWQVSPTPAQFNVSNGTGNVEANAVDTNFFTLSGSTVNVNLTGSFSTDALAVGGDERAYLVARFIDPMNYYRAGLNIMTDQSMTLFITRVSGGVETALDSQLMTFTHVANDRYHIRFQLVGDSLQAKAWADGSPEPAFQLSVNDSIIAGAGAVGTRNLLDVANTNPLPVTFSWDDMVAFDPTGVVPQYATVTRRNTVTGEIVTLRPYVAFDENGNLLLDCDMGLWWDTEPPLDVPLEYCAVAADVPLMLTGNCCFEADAGGWTGVNGASVSQDCFIAKEGNCSGQMIPNSAFDNPGIFQDFSGLVGGVPFTMSGWAMSADGWPSVRLRIVLTYTDTTTETFVTENYLLPDGEWIFMRGTFTPRMDASARFFFEASGSPTGLQPFNVDVLSVTQPRPLQDTACVTVTVPSNGNMWLKSPLNPCSDVKVGICDPALGDCEPDARVSYLGMTEQLRNPNTLLLYPANRRHPIPVNRRRQDVIATLRLLAHDCEARDAIVLANDPGDPLFLQLLADYCFEDRYISVQVLGEAHVGVDQRDDFRLMTLPFVTVDRPTGPANGICGARITDLCDIYGSWNAMNMAQLTWDDLLKGAASPQGPGQAPAPGSRTWGDVELEFADWAAVEAGGTRTWAQLRDGA